MKSLFKKYECWLFICSWLSAILAMMSVFARIVCVDLSGCVRPYAYGFADFAQFRTINEQGIELQLILAIGVIFFLVQSMFAMMEYINEQINDDDDDFWITEEEELAKKQAMRVKYSRILRNIALTLIVGIMNYCVAVFVRDLFFASIYCLFIFILGAYCLVRLRMPYKSPVVLTYEMASQYSLFVLTAIALFASMTTVYLWSTLLLQQTVDVCGDVVRCSTDVDGKSFASMYDFFIYVTMVVTGILYAWLYMLMRSFRDTFLREYRPAIIAMLILMPIIFIIEFFVERLYIGLVLELCYALFSMYFVFLAVDIARFRARDSVMHRYLEAPTKLELSK